MIREILAAMAPDDYVRTALLRRVYPLYRFYDEIQSETGFQGENDALRGVFESCGLVKLQKEKGKTSCETIG